MTLTPSGRGMNVLACTFTPTGGSALPITGVKTATLNQNPQKLTDGSDGDFFDTFGGVVSGSPEVTLNLNKPFMLDAVAPGTYGVLTFTVADLVNKAAVGGGAQIYTLSNCFYMPAAQTSQHRQFSTKDISFQGLSVDGTTNPLGFAAA